jgi:hypothetical protein
MLLVVERWPKRVRPGVPAPTADERADIVARAFIWWVVPLFGRARKKPALTAAVLPEIEPQLTRAADEGNDVLREQSIFQHLVAVRGGLLASAILPRLCYTGLLYAQPFLVQRATEFVTAPRDINTNKIGGGLIAAYAIVYVGIAVRQPPTSWPRVTVVLNVGLLSVSFSRQPRPSTANVQLAPSRPSGPTSSRWFIATRLS